MIGFEEYNDYMLHIVCFHKTPIDNETIYKKQEQQHKQEEVELKRINYFKERERREPERE